MRTSQNPSQRTARRAFTLIEVLIVLGIVLALSAIIGVSVLGRRDDAKLKLAETNLNTLKNGLKLFLLDFERYPTEEEGIAVLWNKELLDADAEQTTWKSYIEQPMANDPWGNAWGYRAESENDAPYDLWSNGPDGEEGTEDDITSWKGLADDEAGGAGGLEPLPSGGGTAP